MVLSNDYHSICITPAALRKLIEQMLSHISCWSLSCVSIEIKGHNGNK